MDPKLNRLKSPARTDKENSKLAMTDEPSADSGESVSGNDDKEDTDDDYPCFLEGLSQGFQYLRSKREGSAENPPDRILPTFLHHVSVNFIDPTTSSIATTSATTHQPVQLYEKFCEVFERDYHSTLSYVPYQLFRNNSNGVIERLPVKTVVARSHGGGVLLPDEDAAKSAVHDYSWERPYCYVYLAACESLEHYRTKVKPSIQAFVSQLEAANKSKSRRSSGTPVAPNGNSDSPVKTRKRYTTSPRYVIIYIPTGDRVEESTTSAPMAGSNAKNAGLASRFAAAARQRMVSTGATDASTHSTVDSVHDGTDDDTVSSNPTSQKLSKTERETAKRFNQDFPTGNVCTLSHLAEMGSTSESAWEKLEWNTVMKAIGAAIAGGFQDRCHRFDDELRKLDLQRRGEAKPASNTEEDATRFHLVNFFLVKESLAFMYEQMRLPGEALLQYEELRAFLPDSEPKAKVAGRSLDMLRVALSGDVLDFRSILRSKGQFDEATSSAVEEYIFARELSLLFQMHKSVRIAKRCVSYVHSKFDSLQSIAEQSDQLAWLDELCFGFCWDFRVATQSYLTGEKSRSNYFIAFTKSICELLEFARHRLMARGNDLFQDSMLLDKNKDFASSSIGPWEPWSESLASTKSATNGFAHNTGPFLKEALTSERSFRLGYLELTSYLAEFSELSGRKRYAARLRLQRMELYDELGEKQKAAQELFTIIDIYEQDSWSVCQFSVMFRLATFCRELKSASEYLAILIRCFGKTLSPIAPKEALKSLHSDLVAVLNSPATKGSTLSAAPLFGPIFGLEGVISHKATGTDRSLLKRLYTIGDSVSVTLSLSSFLPESTKLDGIFVNLVPFPIYVSAMEDNIPIAETDVIQKLTVENPADLSPGENLFTLDWLPPSPGQYILASCALSWEGSFFTYSAKELKRPTIRIDIVPGKPTQKLNVSPTYLFPGHEQAVKFTFSSGSETVSKAVLQIVGSPGVDLKLSTGDERWLQSLETSLPGCPPAETVSIEVIAKVLSTEESDASVQPLRATLSSTYKCAGDESDMGDMETELETSVPVRSRPALSVSSCNLVPCGPGKCMLSVSVRCNTPSAFQVKDWRVQFPPFVRLCENGDLNTHLQGVALEPSDKLFFSFMCLYDGNLRDLDPSGASLSVSFCNDSGVLFCETMGLNVSWPKMHNTSTEEFSGRAETKIVASTTTSNVGVPIELAYQVTCTSLITAAKGVYYEIDFDDSFWIVTGNIQGKVDQSVPGFTINATAIPVQPGETDSLPKLRLLSETESGMTCVETEIPPTTFVASPHRDQSTVAYSTKAVSRRGSSQRS